MARNEQTTEEHSTLEIGKSRDRKAAHSKLLTLQPIANISGTGDNVGGIAPHAETRNDLASGDVRANGSNILLPSG